MVFRLPNEMKGSGLYWKLGVGFRGRAWRGYLVRQPEKQKPLAVAPTSFLLDGLGFRLHPSSAQFETEHGVSPPYPLFSIAVAQAFQAAVGHCKGSLKQQKPLGVLPCGFLLDRLTFRLPNSPHTFNTAALPPYVQPNAASFFRKQTCACPTTRKARLVRTRRKKDAE